MKNYLFRDAGGAVKMQVADRYLDVDRWQFIKWEPDYSLPDGYIERSYDGDRHCLFTADSQELADDISSEQLDEYLSKIEDYRAMLPSKTEAEPLADLPSFIDLQAALRGTAAWSKMFGAMARSVRANAAGTLILTAIAGTQDRGDLIGGFRELLAAMDGQAGIAAFSDDEIKQIKDALISARFEPASFGIDRLA